MLKQKLYQKEKARKLRRHGWTYPEIQNKINVHRTTLNNWCRDIQLTPSLIKSRDGRYLNRLKGAKANHLKRQKEIKKIKEKANKEINSLNFYEFKIAGTALYWGEGNKTFNLGFSNSDPKLIIFMMEWFRKICQVSNNKFRVYLYLHTRQNEQKMRRYWSEIANIPKKQFYKTIFKEGHLVDDQYRGTLKIIILDEDLKHRILAWVEQLQYFTNHS